MPAIFFALVSYIGWGVSDFFVTISARRLNSYSSTFWAMVISIFALSFYAPFVLNDLKNLTPGIFLLNIFLGSIMMLAIILYREALIRGSSPLIVTIGAAFSAVTTILSIIFFQEKIAFNQIVSIVVIFLGLFLTTLPVKDLIKGKIILSRGVVLVFGSMILWGIYFTFIKIPVREIGWFWPNYFTFLFFPPLILWIMKKRKVQFYMPTHNKALIPLFLAVVLSRLAELSFNLAISKGYTSVVAPIAGANPTLFIVLAFFFLKDPVTKQQLLGIVTTLMGIVLLSLFSV